MDSPEHERRSISEYVENEAPEEKVLHAEKISEDHVMGTKYAVWDVETNKTRWWVLTNPTNLYAKDEFKSMDYVLSFHIGLAHRVWSKHSVSSEGRTGETQRNRLKQAWRKWELAAKACDSAAEAEDYQAVGMHCREALLAFVRGAKGDEMVPQGETAPKLADFIHWSEYIAATVCPDSARLRRYLRQLAAQTWDLVSWLTHEQNARQFDAVIACDATAHLLGTFGMALVRHERGLPWRCPECQSYRVVEDYRVEEDNSIRICDACGWESEPY